MEIYFKAAQESDIDVMLGFMRELYEYDGSIPFEEPETRVALEQIIKDDSLGRVWLIVQNNIAIGYVVLTFGYSLEYHGRDAIVDELYLQEDYRGRGIGTKSLEFVTEVCRSLGVHALHLEVERTNVKAQNFYRKFGFEDHDRYLLTKWITPSTNP